MDREVTNALYRIMDSKHGKDVSAILKDVLQPITGKQPTRQEIYETILDFDKRIKCHN